MSYTITYQGPVYTINQAYAGHWRTRKKKRDELKTTFARLYHEQLPAGITFPAFTLHVRYNTRGDADGLTAHLKCALDQLRASGHIKDDSRDTFQGYSVFYDCQLPAKTITLTIQSVGAA